MPRKRRRLDEDLLGLGRASFGIATGSMLVGVPALKAPAGIKQSFGVAASFMPLATVGVMGKHMLHSIQDIKPKKYKRRR